MPKYGKIARLPRSIRDELNRRLDDGWTGPRLVQWLNSLPEVKQLLQTDFAGREITRQNLYEWKTNGYLRWQAQQERLALARELNTDATELAASGDQSDALARLITTRYADLIYDWNGEISDEFRARLRGLRGLSREVVRLRRSDQSIESMKIQREWLALGYKASDLNQRRYQDNKRGQEEQALAICCDEARQFPEVQALFRQAFQALKDAEEAK